MIKEYYTLTKPGLVLGNIFTVIAGFAVGLRASGGMADVTLFIATIVGIGLVMASGCVFNNYIDRDIDPYMARTKGRGIVTGKVSPRAALIYGTVLGLTGFFILGFYTNLLATAAAVIGFFFYVIAYTIWGKRRTVHGTAIGSTSGAIPPVVGYCAASGRFDLGAVILFLILALWQMPHFFAIGIYRHDDYAATNIPILPVKRGIKHTKVTMLIYIVLFSVAALSLATTGYAGPAYFAVASVLCLAWLMLGIRGLYKDDAASKSWARRMFSLSLIVLCSLSIMMVLGLVVK